MNQPLISIITVTRNDAIGLAETIRSVENQNYDNIEYIVIDGNSNDNSKDVLAQHDKTISRWLSEPDNGIYHAMNKGLLLASGEWIIFMNSGDKFFASNSLQNAADCIEDNAAAIYSDWNYEDSNKNVKANIHRMNVRHQSVMYRKKLHDLVGNYVSHKQVTISDYIFFQSISQEKWVFCETPISVCDRNGVSSLPSHFQQRIATEFIFGYRGKFSAIFILLIHPLYHFFKNRILRSH